MVLRAGWDALGMWVLGLLGRRPVLGYGWLEALLSPSCYYWFRYTDVIAGLNMLAPVGQVRLTQLSQLGQ